MANYNFSDWGEAKAAPPQRDFERLPADGYVCKILGVRTRQNTTGNLLEIFLDIESGKYKNYFRKNFPAKTPDDWHRNARLYRYMQRFTLKGFPKTTGSFRGLIETLERDNPEWHFDPNNFTPESLKGLVTGIIFGEEEFQGRDGKIHTAVRAQLQTSIEDIREGRFKVPEVKKVEVEEPTPPPDLKDEEEVVDLPF